MPAGGPRATRGEHGVVVSVEPHATRAGVEVLERGGNAIDAAVAVAFVLAVTHPSAGNVGGGGYLLARSRDGRVRAFDFRERAPSGLTDERFRAMIDAGGRGPASSGVPGTVAGLGLAHRQLGRLPFAELVAPAARLARDGHPLGARQAAALGWAWRVLRKDPEARRIFGDARGRPRVAGARLVQKDLATTLDAIAAAGDAGFYAGKVAERLVRHAASAGATMSLSDLSEYRAIERSPLAFRYRGIDVAVAPPSSAGGVAVAQMLLGLERLRAHELQPGSPAAVHTFLEVSKRAHAERRFAVGDPDALAPTEDASLRSRWLDPARAPLQGPAIDGARATPAAEIHGLYAKAVQELEHTTHFSIVDADGNAVSCTTTLSAGYGAGYVAPGTGVVMNNAVAAFGTAGANVPRPGRRPTSSMTPTIVARGGELAAVLGTPGGDTIPSTVVQVLRNLVDHQMTLDAAVDAPRIHHGLVPDEVRTEKARPVSKELRHALEALGHRFGGRGLPIGDANDLVVSGGVAYAYADPREGGLALAARNPK